jgi:hypothetical protein
VRSVAPWRVPPARSRRAIERRVRVRRGGNPELAAWGGPGSTALPEPYGVRCRVTSASRRPRPQDITS